MWKAWLVAATLVLSGCGGQKLIVKGYQGAELPKEQVGWVKPVAGLHVHSIDGDKAIRVITIHSVGYYDAEIALPAGPHRLEVAYAEGSARSRESMFVDVVVRPQGKYLLRAVFSRPESTGFFLPPATVRVEVQDMTDEPEKWCANRPRC